MSDLAGFNIEDLVNVTTCERGESVREITPEELTGRLKKLRQGKSSLEDEIGEAQLVSDSLQKELETLQTEADKLMRVHREKEELCRKLQFQCEESEQKSARQLKQNKKNDELLEQYRCEIQEFKLKHRKQRMKFENHLHQLIEQHKILNSMFTLESLPDEIGSAENTKFQLLSAEQVKLVQLAHLNKELEEVRNQKESEKTAPETQEEPNTSL